MSAFERGEEFLSLDNMHKIVIVACEGPYCLFEKHHYDPVDKRWIVEVDEDTGETYRPMFDVELGTLIKLFNPSLIGEINKRKFYNAGE